MRWIVKSGIGEAEFLAHGVGDISIAMGWSTTQSGGTPRTDKK